MQLILTDVAQFWFSRQWIMIRKMGIQHTGISSGDSRAGGKCRLPSRFTQRCPRVAAIGGSQPCNFCESTRHARKVNYKLNDSRFNVQEQEFWILHHVSTRSLNKGSARQSGDSSAYQMGFIRGGQSPANRACANRPSYHSFDLGALRTLVQPSGQNTLAAQHETCIYHCIVGP